MQKSCPNCQRVLAANAIICIDCGYNLESGVLLATRVVQPPEEADWEKGLRTSGHQFSGVGFAAQHLFLAFCVGVVGPMVHEAFSDIDYSLDHWYTYVALELTIPSFLLGMYFAPTARFPFRGFVGLGVGFVIGTEIINAWFGSAIKFLIPLIVPTVFEIVGIAVGKVIAGREKAAE